MKVKLIRQPLLGQMLLGIDAPAMPAALKPGENISYATTLMPEGPYVAQRSDYKPFYDQTLWVTGIQKAYNYLDALGNPYKLPASLINGIARARSYTMGPGAKIQISGALIQIIGHGNDNPIRDYTLIYGDPPTQYSFTFTVPRNIGFTTVYVAPLSFATWYNAEGPRTVFNIGNTDPIDYIGSLQLRLYSRF